MATECSYSGNVVYASSYGDNTQFETRPLSIGGDCVAVPPGGNTYAHIQSAGNPTGIIYDLGGTWEFDPNGIQMRDYHDGDFWIHVSPDGITWTQVFYQRITFAAAVCQTYTPTWPGGGPYRYIRFQSDRVIVVGDRAAIAWWCMTGRYRSLNSVVMGRLGMPGAGAGRTYTTQTGTVWLKQTVTFDAFTWGGRCMRIDGDISETLRAMTVTHRMNPLGGVERDGVLLDPPGETTFTLMMKRKQAEREKTNLKKCFYIIDERMHCKDPQAFHEWEEITRNCVCAANSRTTSGTSFDGTDEEAMIGLPETCLETVDVYRVTGEEATT
jgi:hypothetical protein